MTLRPPLTYLPAIGITCALGTNNQEIFDAFINAHPQHAFFEPVQDCISLLSGRCVPKKSIPFMLPPLPQSYVQMDTYNNRLLKLALDQIAETVDLLKQRYGKERIGVVLGTSSTGMAEGEAAYVSYRRTGSWPSNYHYMQQELFNPSLFTSQYLGVEGPSYTVSTACTSGAKAMCAGRRLIESNICDAVIAGGVDTLCDIILNGFDSLELLSEEVCNPFSKNRKGIMLGEGAAVFVITKEALSDNPSIIFSGYGESSDAYHISSPDPSGSGIEKAIFQALHTASLEPADITYINLHGTGSFLNDAMESKCVSRIFPLSIPCSSTKALTGHTLGTSGALEAGLLWLCLQHRKKAHMINLPPHVWDGRYDLRNPSINLVENTECQVLPSKPIHLMSNTFAFGGSNVILILSQFL